MNEDRPPRRVRYKGSHPRRFDERYKEQQPQKYPDEIEHIVASGKTPAGSHRPIMVDEILKVLSPRPGDIAIDCTLGYGGHSERLLEAIQPSGRLIAVDLDPIELPKTEARLRSLGYPAESLVIRRTNFAGINRLIQEVSPEGVDCLLADFGVSSMQLDDPARGFSFQEEGPLDMRMNPQHGQPAAILLKKINEQELAQLFAENADEPLAVEIARAILAAQEVREIETTSQLANVVAEVVRERRRTPDEIKLTIRRVFQAIRIAVNDEFGAIDALLRQMPDCLKPGGRVAILTFHSGEDRRVKKAFKEGLRNGIYSQIADDPIRASFDEQRSNPRSSSAKLRFAIRR
jgi:16S rRNA (cytosine1402-N4)-methyltransferase